MAHWIAPQVTRKMQAVLLGNCKALLDPQINGNLMSKLFIKVSSLIGPTGLISLMINCLYLLYYKMFIYVGDVGSVLT